MKNMILTFSRTSFVEAITEGRKIHTLRADKNNRWQPGRRIHFWYGNPRNKNISTAFAFGYGAQYCTGTEAVSLYYQHGQCSALVEDRILELPQLNLLAFQDGFESIQELYDFFFPTPPENGEPAQWHGKIIHWTDFRYATDLGR